MSYRLSDASEFLSSGATVHDYVSSLLARIEARDADVQGSVLAQARELDRVPLDKRGPLHGVPIGVKDIFLTKDMPTQHNSAIYENDAPAVDAALISLLRSAGALILGKTTTTEFAHGIHTDTRTPRTPGGSSSGSGAAVGDFQVPIALGTQTIGSIIRPASFNGVFGIKPTWGSISREGAKICSVNFDTMGFLARSVADLELLADVVGLEDDAKPITPFKLDGARFAVCKTHVWSQAGPGTVNALALGIKLLREHGASVEELDLPEEFASVTKSHLTVFQCDAKTTFMNEYIAAKDKLDPVLVGFVENQFTHRQHLEGLDNLAQLRPKIDLIASGYDAILTPSVVDEAPESLATTGNSIFCGMWTALHVPVVNVPGFVGDHGMPIGLSLVSARYTDRHLLRVAAAVAPVFEGGGWKPSV
ncbi:amidase signature domain-containing protein [Roridomyces roridus]|uniref:Amidase signature domain-containing protein n=1 Tax=Roridomyces roridus TaxID=1738132 RepID=A0AAD7BKF1_9AGAR|nr:amidase signature domain-containing protein [Roridomyces roridus]